MEIIGVTKQETPPEAQGLQGGQQMLHDIFVWLGEICQIVHQAMHEDPTSVDVGVILNAKVEVAKLLDVALAMAIRVEVERERG